MFQNGFFSKHSREWKFKYETLKYQKYIYIINSFLWQGTWYPYTAFFQHFKKYLSYILISSLNQAYSSHYFYLLAHIWLNMLITWLYLMKGSVFGCFRFPTEHTDGQGGSWQMQVHPFLFLLLFQSKLWNHSNPFKIN